MKIYLYILCTVFFASCFKVEESIEPFTEAKSLSQVQKEMFLKIANEAMSDDLSPHTPKYAFDESKPDVFFIKVNYNFSNIDINALAGGSGTFDILANKFIVFFAKIFFKLGGTYDIEIDEINLDIPDLNIDRSIVSAIYIEKVKMRYSDRTQFLFGSRANFNFINKLDITAPYKIPGTENEFDLLLFGYNHTKNKCNFECVDFDIYTYDILDLIGESTSMKFKPELTVQAIPVNQMEFSGNVEVIIELKLPF